MIASRIKVNNAACEESEKMKKLGIKLQNSINSDEDSDRKRI